MVRTGDYQPRLRNFFDHHVERLQDGLEALIRSPLTECQDAVFSIATLRKVRTLAANCFEHSPWIAQAVELPATNYFEAFEFGLRRGMIVAQNRKVDFRNASKLARNMKAVFVERVTTGRKRCHQAYFHRWPGPKSA